MSDSEQSRVFMFDSEDPEMQKAFRQAQNTFRYFWRELVWDRRRIVPGLELACVKAIFVDPPNMRDPNNPGAEHMWLSDVDFDGQHISGTLLNAPNWIRSVREGDAVHVPLSDVSDWMYSLMGTIYGAFTVNLMRSRMSPHELADHDGAWGMNFGDPRQIHLVSSADGSGPGNDLASDHPMSVNMQASFVETLQQNPSFAFSADDRGWTMLHELSLAGSTSCVPVLLQNGANPNAQANDGKTPLWLSRVFGWEDVAQILMHHGARE